MMRASGLSGFCAFIAVIPFLRSGGISTPEPTGVWQKGPPDAKSLSANALKTLEENEVELAVFRQQARQDMLLAFSQAPSHELLSLPHSGEFSSAFEKYEATGICSIWTDLHTTRVSNGHDMEDLAVEVQNRPRQSKIKFEDILTATDSGNAKEIASVFLGGPIHPLSQACLIIGSIFFLMWLFFFSWQTCIQLCRQACCCIASKKRSITWPMLLITAITGAVLAIAACLLIVSGQIGLQKSVKSLGSSSCAILDLIRVAEWGTKAAESGGSPSASAAETLPSFKGVRGIAERVNELNSVFSSQGTKIVGSLRDRINNYVNAEVLLKNLELDNQALELNADSLETAAREAHMANYAVEALKLSGCGFDRKVREVYEEYKRLLEEGIDNVTFSTEIFSDPKVLRDIEATTSTLQSFGANAARLATPVVTIAPIALWLEATFVILGVVAAIAALALFFFSQGASSTCFSALSWNWLMFTASLGIITTGLTFWASSVANPICDIAADALKTEGNVDGSNLLETLTASLVGDKDFHLGKCVQEPNYSILDAFGKSSLIENSKAFVDDTETEVLKAFPAFSPPSVLEDIKQISKQISTLTTVTVADRAAFSKDPETSILTDTFPEVFQLGNTEICGVDTLNKVLVPAVVEGSSGNGDFIITTSNPPTETSESFIEWINQQKALKEKELLDQGQSSDVASGEAAKHSKKLKNGILVIQKVLQFREMSVPCYSATAKGLVTETCKAKELYEDDGKHGGRLAWYSNKIALTAFEITSRLENLAVGGRKHPLGVAVVRHEESSILGPGEYVSELFTVIRESIKNIQDSLSCSFVRKTVVEATFLGCTTGTDQVWASAFVRFMGQLFAILLALLIFVIWRIQRDNDCQNEKDEAEQLVDEDVPTEDAIFEAPESQVLEDDILVVPDVEPGRVGRN